MEAETTAAISARNRALAREKAAKLLCRMAACNHDWRQFSELDLSGIYCRKCHTLLDASLGDPWWNESNL